MSAFFKIQVRPPSELRGQGVDPFYSLTGWFIVAAHRPREASNGATYFGHLELTDDLWQAAVYPEFTARNILAIVRPFHPEAKLCEATFADWVQAMPLNS